MPLSPNYNPKDNKTQIYSQWMNAKIGSPKIQFTKNYPLVKRGQTKSGGISKTHSILMPPPNLTGDLHAGHAFQHYLMDTLSRIARQKGEQNLWFPGVDHAGLQLEGVIDKLIKKVSLMKLLKKSTCQRGSKSKTLGGLQKTIFPNTSKLIILIYG